MATFNIRRFKKLIRNFSSNFLFSKAPKTEKDLSFGAYLLPIESQTKIKDGGSVIEKKIQRKKTSNFSNRYVQLLKQGRSWSALRLMVQSKILKNHHFNFKSVRPILAGILIVVLLVQIFLPEREVIYGATYTFAQTSWAGGADVNALAAHPVDQTAFNKYYAKDANWVFTNNSTHLQLATSSAFVTSTDDTNSNTGFNLNGAVLSSSVVSGSGANASVKLDILPNANVVTSSFSASQSHTLALKSDGTVWAWGTNSSGELGIGSSASQILPIQVKSSDGIGYLTGVTSITAGQSFSVALKSDGTVWAWGLGDYGQLGNNYTLSKNIPVQVLGPGGAGYLTGIVAIASGYRHSLALKSDGTVWAWGFNSSGQLGNNGLTTQLSPVQVLGPGGVDFLTGIIAVAVGDNHSLALKSDGTVWAWGVNNYGQLGNNNTTLQKVPVQVVGLGGSGFLTGVVAIAGSRVNGGSLALKSDGTVWAWGVNSGGQLGINAADSLAHSSPVQVLGPSGTGNLSNITAIAAGQNHSLALKSDGTVWAWGNNTYGQLGINSVIAKYLPTQVLGPGGVGNLTGVTTIQTGVGHSLALKSDGTVWAWGNNTNGQLGIDSLTQQNVPVALNRYITGTSPFSLSSSLFTTSSIASANSGNYSLALKSDGTVWAWGYNSSGQLGINSTVQQNAAVQVLGPSGVGYLTGVVSVGMGSAHSLAVKFDGTVWTWGFNASGQLGNNNTNQQNAPVQVLGPGGSGNLTGVIAVTGGGSHSLALKSDGTVWGWGGVTRGQLGINLANNGTYGTPVQVLGPGGAGFLTGVVTIAAGLDFSLALKSDGTVWAWGNNTDGQLGINNTTQQNAPVQVLGPGGAGFLTGVVAIAAGTNYSLAVKSDGTVWGWGGNSFGQLGVGNNGTCEDASEFPIIYYPCPAGVATPVQVLGPGGTGNITNITSVSAGQYFTTALKSDGTVWGWGQNYNTVPFQISGPGGVGYLTGITAIASGVVHSLALKSDGTVWGWGQNNFGQLGDFTINNSNYPVSTVVANYSTNYKIFQPLTYYSSGTYVSGPITIPNQSWTTLSFVTTTVASTTVSLKARSANNSAMTGATAWSSCSNLSSGSSVTSGGCVTAGDQYIQYQATLSTSDTSVTPSLDSVSLGYNFYIPSATLTSSPYDSGDSGNVMGSVDWTALAPSGTSVTISLRTSPSSTMSNATAWHDFTTTTLFAGLPAEIKDGAGDRYFQYKITAASTGANTPDISRVAVQYVVNAPPEIRNVTATQNNDGTVSISYEARSVDTLTDTGSEGHITPTFQYCTGGTSCTTISALSAGATSSQLVDSTNWTTYNVTWTPTSDTPNAWDETATIKVTINDLQAANNLASTSSPAFVLDTTPPSTTPSSLIVVASTSPNPTIYFNASDTSTPVLMRYATSLDSLNSSSYITYSSSVTLSLTNPASVYAQFKDSKSNQTAVLAVTTPETPSAMMVQDTSNFKVTPKEYRLFVAWKTVSQPNQGTFGSYKVYRSTSGSGPWTLVRTEPDINMNSFADNTAVANTLYYYKVISVDSYGNTSFPSSVINAMADGIQDYGEGGGGALSAPAISNVATSTIKGTSAIITWDTDTLSNSTVRYSTTPGSFSLNTVSVSSMVDNSSSIGPHQVFLSGLTPNTTYYFEVSSANSEGTQSNDDNGGQGYSFTTTDGPVILVPNASPGNTSAAITWTTDQPATSKVYYSTSTDFSAALNVSDLAPVTTHSVSLTSLTTSTKYYYFVESTLSGAAGTSEDRNVFNGTPQYYSFSTTNDTNLPTFTNFQSTPSTSTVVISWQTNKDTDSQLDYGATVSYGTQSELDTILTKVHSLTISGLTPNTTYHYRARGTDANGNLGLSADQTFKTIAPLDTAAPAITNVATSSISLTSATITWNTDENANATVEYDTNSTSFSHLVGNQFDFTTSSHSVTLTDLVGNTLYYFRVNSADQSGNAASSTGTFLTEADVTPPVITSTSTLANDTAAFVNWTTNELAFSEVNYGTSTDNLDVQVSITSTPRTNHSLPLTGLSPSTTYFFNIVTADPSANTTTVGPYQFTTPVFGMQTVIIDNTKPTVVIDNTRPSDTTPPTISNLQVTNNGAFGVTITWTTDQDGTSLVRYGRSVSYGSFSGDYINRTSAHSVVLANLNPATTYHFMADSEDSSGNLGSSADTTFTTLNIDGTEAKPTDVTPDQTVEDKQASERQFVLDKIIQAPLTLLSGILEAIAQNPFLRDLPEDSAVKSFSSIVSQIGEAPVIVGLRPQVEVHGNNAIIRWSTDKKTLGMVSFAKEKDYLAGAEKPYTTTIVDGDSVSTVHSVELTGLESATRYHFQVASKGEIGPEARSKDYTFETEAILPEVSGIKITDIKATSAVISWKSNVPTASTLEYTNLKSDKTLQAGDPALLVMHTFTLQNLEPGVKYNLVIKAKNESGQEQPSDAATFETIIDKVGPAINSVMANSTLYPGATSKVQTIVSWDTDEEATCQLFYQPGVQDNPDLLKSAPKETSGSLKHFVVLTSFAPGSVYKYWLDCSDLSGNETTSDKFTTLAPVQQQTIIDIITKNFQGVFGWTKNVGL